jgi:hypothetical protein
MQKMQELLLVLSNEERDEAEEFINRKLKLLDADQLADLEDTASSGQTTLEEIRQESIQIDGGQPNGQDDDAHLQQRARRICPLGPIL